VLGVTKVKPRIIHDSYAQWPWWCIGGRVSVGGNSPADAYNKWVYWTKVVND
jgi:hypothetical protein